MSFTSGNDNPADANTTTSSNSMIDLDSTSTSSSTFVQQPPPAPTWNRGVYFTEKAKRLSNALTDGIVASSNSQIFKGCIVFVHNDGVVHPPRTRDKLMQCILENGGEVVNYEMVGQGITHHILPKSGISESYLHELLKRRKGVNENKYYVTVDWVDKSVEANKRQNENLVVPSYLKEQTNTIEAHFSSSSSSCIKSPSKSPVKSSSSLSLTTQNNPQFLSDYNAHSRLGFIANWRTRCQEWMNEIGPLDYSKLPLYPVIDREQQGTQGTQGTQGAQRVVLHVDMDCFFVSVMCLGQPDLLNRPCAVAHSSGKGSTSDISSCNYAARTRGCRNGMSIGRAKALVPELSVLPYDFDKITTVSKKVFTILYHASELFQPVSVDEAYIELPPNTNGLAAAKILRKLIKDETGCNASAGVGPNKLLARIATSKAKPDGEFEISQRDAIVHLKELPPRSLPGVGRKLAEKLEEYKMIGDMHSTSEAEMKRKCGDKKGSKLYHYSRGIDNDPVESCHTPKTASKEVNWALRFDNWSDAELFLGEIVTEATRKAVQLDKYVSGVVVNVKKSKNPEQEPAKFLGHGLCDDYSKTKKFEKPIFVQLSNALSTEQIMNAAIDNLRAIVEERTFNAKHLRGLGVTLNLIESSSSSSSSSCSSRSDVMGRFIKVGQKRDIYEGFDDNSESDSDCEDKEPLDNNHHPSNMIDKPIRGASSSAPVRTKVRVKQPGISDMLNKKQKQIVVEDAEDTDAILNDCVSLTPETARLIKELGIDHRDQLAAQRQIARDNKEAMSLKDREHSPMKYLQYKLDMEGSQKRLFNNSFNDTFAGLTALLEHISDMRSSATESLHFIIIDFATKAAARGSFQDCIIIYRAIKRRGWEAMAEAVQIASNEESKHLFGRTYPLD